MDLDLPKNNEPYLTENCNPASKQKYRKKTKICIANRNTIYKATPYNKRKQKKIARGHEESANSLSAVLTENCDDKEFKGDISMQ